MTTAAHRLGSRVRRATGTPFCFSDFLLGGAVGFAFAARQHLLILAGAALVGYGAAGFAGALAGALAFAASAMSKRLTQARFCNGLKMFHRKSLQT